MLFFSIIFAGQCCFVVLAVAALTHIPSLPGPSAEGFTRLTEHVHVSVVRGGYWGPATENTTQKFTSAFLSDQAKLAQKLLGFCF
jgi:hypothetical protein